MKVFLCVLLLLPVGLVVASGPVELARDEGVLNGTLLLPEVENPVLVVLHSGSGPTDRDGNQAGMTNNSLKMLAEALVGEGVATLRYDKRGLGGGISVNEVDLRPRHFIDDLAAWVSWARADGRFGQVVLLGHSEGALFAKVVGVESDVDAVISLSGAGRPAGVILREQVSGQLPAELAGDFERVLASLEGGELVDDAPAMLQALFRPTVQPYMREWLGMDPAAIAASMTNPLLVIGGSTDVQVGRADFDRLAEATGNGQSVWIEGMNHVLKPVEGALAEQVPSYMNPELELHPELVPTITGFLTNLR
jgi:uncharacterized protein